MILWFGFSGSSLGPLDSKGQVFIVNDDECNLIPYASTLAISDSDENLYWPNRGIIQKWNNARVSSLAFNFNS